MNSHETSVSIAENPTPPFTFVEAHHEYSLYTDANGEHVFLANRRYGRRWHGYYGWPDVSGLPNDMPLRVVLSAVSDYDLSLDEASDLLAADADTLIGQCERCDDLLSNEDLYSVDGGAQVWCSDCVSSLAASCSRCGEVVTDWHTVDGDGTACTSCADNHTSYCDRCEVRYWDDDENHYHDDEDCGCEALDQTFSIAGIGQVRYDNDQHYEVAALEGEIRNDGTWVIERTVRNWVYARAQVQINNPETGLIETVRPEIHPNMRPVIRRVVHEVGTAYKTKEGAYAKRLRSAVYKTTKRAIEEDPSTFASYSPVALPDDLLAKVGDLARKYSTAINYKASITRDLNQEAGEFANDESCWWTEYAYSRCTLKSNAGFALRTWFRGGYGNDEADGRVWVIPCTVYSERGLAKMVPTRGEAEAYLVFNGYGTLDDGAGAHLLAAMTGMHVGPHRLSFSANGNMYVNGETSYVVAPQELLDGSKGDLRSPRGLERHDTLPTPEEEEKARLARIELAAQAALHARESAAQAATQTALYAAMTPTLSPTTTAAQADVDAWNARAVWTAQTAEAGAEQAADTQAVWNALVATLPANIERDLL